MVLMLFCCVLNCGDVELLGFCMEFDGMFGWVE